MTMNDAKKETGELNDAQLNAVTGGTVVDTVVGVATTIWNILTSPPRGVKGESKDHKHQGD